MNEQGYLKVSEIAQRWGMSARRVRLLCAEGRVSGVVRKGNLYFIPADAEPPVDARKRRAKTASYSPLLSEVDKLYGQLKSARPLTPAEVERMREVFLVEHTYNSNAIEGNTLTLRETALVLQGMTIDKKPLREHLEVVGYKEAYEYVEQLASEHRDLTESTILNIHSLVLAHHREDRGRWRRVPVAIAGAATSPVQPYLIEPMVGALISDYNNSYRNMHIVERVASFHLRFESIHPFIDGNGRTGRLLMNLQLIKDGYPPVNVKFSDRRRYYDAFDDYATSGSAEAMIRLVAECLKERLTAMIEVLR